MTTFCVHILGCKVNQYEGEQIAAVLRGRGLRPASPEQAELHVIHTCSVTSQAAATSRRTVRRATRLPVLNGAAPADPPPSAGDLAGRIHANQADAANRRVVVTGCWATSNPGEARQIPGVDAVVTHHEDVAARLDRLLDVWLGNGKTVPGTLNDANPDDAQAEPVGDDGWMKRGADSDWRITSFNRPRGPIGVKENPGRSDVGTHALPVLDQRVDGHQRAFVKIQDGCDAHCTYCIIPRLRPGLWSKPVDAVADEVQRLVDAGHREVVLTGIFLGAYGQETALRRRQAAPTAHRLAALAEALDRRVPELRRLRFSSLEPGDLTPDVIRALRDLPQVVPHFHLPLQSGSNALLRRMNRQYTRDDFLRLVELVGEAFDRPALTTDIICGFPGETDAEFAQTLDVVDRARFIHIHAFTFSPRQGTAAARWRVGLVPPAVANARIHELRRRAAGASLAYRRGFVGQTVEVLVERDTSGAADRHGRCPRYFSVHFAPVGPVGTGDAVRVRIDQADETETRGTMLETLP